MSMLQWAENEIKLAIKDFAQSLKNTKMKLS